MDVSIVYVNYKTKDLTINSIKSVIEKTTGLNYEIFVVDNNSQDGSIEAIEQEFNGIELAPHSSLPREGKESSPLMGRDREGCAPIYIIKNPINAGFGAANNLAIEQARGKYILCLNTDTLLINNAIKILFDYMEMHPDVGACGGNLLDKEGNPTGCGGKNPGIIRIFYSLIEQFTKRSLYKTVLNIDESNDGKNLEYICGANIFLRKTTLDKVGIFDENIFMYNEEADLCKRIQNAGQLLRLVKDAKIQHLEGQTTKNYVQKKIWAKTSEMYYFKKHYPFKYLLVKLIYIVLYLTDWLILGHTESKKLLDIVIQE